MVFDELFYGNFKKVDLHNQSKEEARATLCAEIDALDSVYSGIMVVHGYHGGHVLKDFVRKEFVNDKIESRKNVDASRTFLKINAKMQ